MLTLQIKEKEIENLTPEEEFIRGTVGAKCQINFDEFWQSYNKYIVFKRVGYEPINFMVDTFENEIEIPYTILAESGEFKIGVFGTTETETLPTLYSKDIKILYGTDTHGTTPPTYIPSEIDQLRLSKQDKLVSGENIKTVNGESILGSGNVEIQVEVDQIYLPTSENAQSGKAVAEAVSGYVVAEVGKGLSSNDFTNEDKEKLYSALQNENIDQTYTPESDNAQSGKAVAEALSTEQKRADNTFANALKGNKSDTAILLDDVSPVTHEMVVRVKSKNLLNYEDFQPAQIISGINFTNNGDGTVTASGTATKNAIYHLLRDNEFLGHYTLSGCPSGGSTTTYLMALGDSNIADIGNGTTRYFSKKQVKSIFIKIFEGVTVENLVFKPQLELGTTSTAYTPYVPDLTAVKVSRCGKNLFNINDNSRYISYKSHTDTDINKDGQLKPIFSISNLIEGESYTISYHTENSWVIDSSQLLWCLGTLNAEYPKGKFLQSIGNGKNSYDVKITFVAPTEKIFFFGSISPETISNFQIENGTTFTTYEPYIGEDYTPNADGTVNGVTSLYPNTTLMTGTDGVLIDCEYNRDINKAFAALEAAIATNNS